MLGVWQSYSHRERNGLQEEGGVSEILTSSQEETPQCGRSMTEVTRLPQSAELYCKVFLKKNNEENYIIIQHTRKFCYESKKSICHRKTSALSTKIKQKLIGV